MTADGEIRSVSLRILRDGPTHNHLLSPLTAYLAAVGPHEAVSVRMPYEHRRLLRDLNALRYGATRSAGPEAGRITTPERRIIADDVSAIFAAVPGLASEMATPATCDGTLTHLCLVFSAAELSLLPFELATAPRGFPGEGLPLSVQVVSPVVITRAIPGAIGRRCPWDRKPRILFAAAAPPGVPDVPLGAHLLALTRALRPWIGPVADFSTEAKEGAAIVEKYLTVLPQATLAEIEQACRTEAYTHVHVLAHSETVDEANQTQFALALHGRHGTKELVSAERLQAALRLPMARRAGDHERSHPLVVSLATCDSGNQAEVIFPTMSLAHALHAAGVPLVVGSLFPLTYRGSVVMTESLYGGLLRGRDPRRVLYDMRHELFRMADETHDWASVVAYASLPDDRDLEGQIQGSAYRASSAGVRAGVDVGKTLIESAEAQHASGEQRVDAARLTERLRKVDDWIARSSSELPLTGAYVLEGQGALAAAMKRRAELFWRASGTLPPESKEAKSLLEESRDKLRHARKLYHGAGRAPRWALSRPQAQAPTLHWVLTQAVSLDLILERRLDWKLWWAATLDAENALDPGTDFSSIDRDVERAEVLWAHASKAELCLLAYGATGPQANGAPVETPGAGGAAETDAPFDERAIHHLRQHWALAHAQGQDEARKSTAENVRRYVGWWFADRFSTTPEASDPVRDRILELAKRMLETLED